MLIERHIKRLRELEQTYGFNEGVCFGTQLPEQLRPPLKSFQEQPREKTIFTTEKSRLDNDEIEELMKKGQELREEFFKEQEAVHRLSPDELTRRYD